MSFSSTIEKIINEIKKIENNTKIYDERAYEKSRLNMYYLYIVDVLRI